MLASVDILDKLKKSYNKGLVSALIGAGFTKNIYPNAVGWWQLLKGVVMEAYDFELKQLYQQCQHTSKGGVESSKSFKECLDDFVDVIIKRDGYLKVVSNYIRYKGCREAIDVYIEENNPYFIPVMEGTKVSGCNDIIPDEQLATHKALLECRWQQIFTTNYDNALEYTSNHFNLGHNVITHDYQLSNQQLNHAIIKIHGSLVDPSKSLEEQFEFDNDRTRRYIISEEDYETYPNRHQAFTYLLRIAMLSGTYCLIGFSGDDPNFLSWLDWVKDILDKHNECREGDNAIKVFLVSVDGAPIGKEKQLFYTNHHIGIINLNDEEVRERLNVNESSSVSHLLQAFFAYLSSDRVCAAEPEEVIPYTQLWKKVYVKMVTNQGQSYADELVQIANYQQKYLFNKAVYFQELIFTRICESKGLLTDEAKRALLLVLADLCKPISSIPIMMQNQLASERQWLDYQTQQHTLLANPNLLNSTTDEENYQNVLRCLFRLDFSQAASLLKNWLPAEEIWVCRKSSLNYCFDAGDSINSLKDIEKNSKNTDVVHFAATLCRYMEVNLEQDIQYKGNSEGISELISYYISLLRQTSSEIVQYGRGHYTTTCKDDAAESLQKSLRLFKLFTDNGLNACYSIVNIISSKDWYLAFSRLYEYYPWACLYYSAQFNDDKVLFRIGEDYAYSSALASELPQIVHRLLVVLKEGSLPFSIRLGLLYICSRMFVAVKENAYFDVFKDYLENAYFVEQEHALYSRASHSFVANALNSLTAETSISAMLTLLLGHYFCHESDVMDFITKHLRWHVLKSVTTEQKKLFFECYERGKLRHSVFLLQRFAHYGFLSDEEKKHCINMALSNEETLMSLPMYPLAVLCMVAGDDPTAVSKLKSVILQREVWGPKSPFSFGGDECFFRFSMLPPEYSFTRSELKIISFQLEEVFNSFLPLRRQDEIFVLFIDVILDEMERYVMAHEKDFDAAFVSTFKVEMKARKHFSSLHQAFYADSSELIEEGLEEIYSRWNEVKFEEIKDYYLIAADRLLFKTALLNTKILSFVADASMKFREEVMADKSITKRLLFLLETYAHVDLRNYDFEVVRATQSFRRIALLFREMDSSDLCVDWWLDADVNKRYNFL